MGNGLNYIREIMQMNLPDTPVEKTVKAAMTEGYSRYQFIGYMDDADVLWAGDPKVVVRLRIGDRGRVQARAHTGDVIMHRNKLYAWCGDHIWLEFNPGPCTPYNGPTPDESLELKDKEEKEDMATEIRYLGEAQSAMRNGLKGPSVMIKGIWERARNLDLVLSGDTLYCYIENKNEWARISTIAFTEKVRYNRIPHGYMTIKNVVFNDPATIVMWQDGTKTIVKCGENDEYDPEKGLAMAIAKKAFGNEGNYYNQIRKWLPAPEEDSAVNIDGGSILDAIRRVNDHIKEVFNFISEKNKTKFEDASNLITDMTINGATDDELIRAIRYSRDVIDAGNGENIDLKKSEADYGIAELRAKYQPKPAEEPKDFGEEEVF